MMPQVEMPILKIKMKKSRSFASAQSLFLLLLMLFACPSAIFAQAKIQVSPSKDVDWGAISYDILNASLLIQNVGNKTLAIMEIRTSCGCTTAPCNKQVLEPGDTTSLNIRVDVHDKVGEQNKKVYVVSNDPVDSVTTINLHAYLARELKPDPLLFPATLGVKIDSVYETDVNLVNISEDTVVLNQPTSHGDGVTVTFNLLAGVRVLPGESAKLRAFVTPKKPGFSSAKVYVGCSGKYNSSITVDLACYVQDKSFKPTFTRGTVAH
jgi:hypothetical protein